MESIHIIRKEINAEIIELMEEDKFLTLITLDDLLPYMAVPVTQLDFAHTPTYQLDALMRSVHRFIRNRRMSTYTKEGLRALFQTQWLPQLTVADKLNILNGYKILTGINEDGFVTFSEEFYNKHLATMASRHPLKYKSHSFVSSKSSLELIEDRDFATYCSYETDGYWCVDLDISKDSWEKIIKDTSRSVKTMLQCYLQVYPERKSMLELEAMFGIDWHSLNACINSLGRRAQSMMNFSVVDPNGKHRVWSTPMTRGRGEKAGFVAEPRKELMEAAREVLEQENFPKLKEV